jgi:hypothetical protein
MDDEVIARMRDRIRHTRRIMELVHYPDIVKLLERMVEEAEADIRRIEAKTSSAIPLRREI